MNTNKLAIFIVFILTLSPFLVSATLNLEQIYPQLPGERIINSQSSLPEVIKYIVGLAILISGAIAFVSLMAGGFSYLSSIGNPAVMNQAKSRILNSLLGVVILIGSYLVLNTINPRLLIMRVEKAPIETGVVLLTQTGKDALASPNNKTLEDLLKNGEAKYLPSEAKDLTELFGGLTAIHRDNDKTTQNDIDEINFENFKPVYLGFFSDERGQDIKVVVYEKKDFLETDGLKKTYASVGEIDRDEGVIAGKASQSIGNLNVISFLFNNANSSIEYKDPEVPDQTFIMNTVRLHPPLSLKMEIKRPGVYLAAANGEIRYFLASNRNFGDFDDQATKIKIKNNSEDFLAILYEDAYLGTNIYNGGELRMFFQQQERNKPVSGSGITAGNLDKENWLLLKNADNQYYDRYGKVNGASSIQLFKIDDSPAETMGCREVKLCKYRDLYPGEPGDCIVYSTTPKDGQLSLPIYNPQNLPDGFNDSVSSLQIKGDCLVVLFENSVKDTGWDDEEPGSDSSVFVKDQTVRDLIKASGSACYNLSLRSALHLWILKYPCASSIAIYPIK